MPHRISEERTRKEMIDPQLEQAGEKWLMEKEIDDIMLLTNKLHLVESRTKQFDPKVKRRLYARQYPT